MAVDHAQSLAQAIVIGHDASNNSMTPSGRIGLYFISVNRNAYLIAKTLALGGCSVHVRCELSEDELKGACASGYSAEREYCSWLYSEEGIRIVGERAVAPPVDTLLYEIGHTRPKAPADLTTWMQKAGRVIAWNTTEHELSFRKNLRAEIGTTVKFLRLLFHTRNVIVGNGRTILRPTAFGRRSIRQGYFVHPKFLREPPLYEEMFLREWRVEEPRPVRIVFSGNAEPKSRTLLLQTAADFLKKRPDVNFLNHYEQLLQLDRSPTGKTILWMMRAAVQDPKWYLRNDVVPPARWPGVLRQSDFAFCPPGFEKKTHRVIESMLQGVIPILDCPDEYDVGLRDGKSCVVVRHGRWHEAVRRALDYSLDDVIRMRCEVTEIARLHLVPSSGARDWLRRLGLAPADFQEGEATRPGSCYRVTQPRS